MLIAKHHQKSKGRIKAESNIWCYHCEDDPRFHSHCCHSIRCHRYHLHRWSHRNYLLLTWLRVCSEHNLEGNTQSVKEFSAKDISSLSDTTQWNWWSIFGRCVYTRFHTHCWMLDILAPTRCFPLIHSPSLGHMAPHFLFVLPARWCVQFFTHYTLRC